MRASHEPAAIMGRPEASGPAAAGRRRSDPRAWWLAMPVQPAFERVVRFLYPRAFAAHFAPEMSGIFADGYSEARARGRFHAFVFTLRELASLVSEALVAHSEDRSRRETVAGRVVATGATWLASPRSPIVLALLSLMVLGGLAGDLVATRGLYWRATQIALVTLLAGVAFRLGTAIARDSRAIVRSFAIIVSTIVVALGAGVVGAIDRAATLAVASSGAAFDASLPGVYMRVVTGPGALSDTSAPPPGFEPTRIRTMTAGHGERAVRTQLFARGVDLAYALLAMLLLALGTAGGFRIERVHRFA